MENAKQDVIAKDLGGGGLLSRLSNLLFKGLDSILDDAAKYEEEMGVLKQVNHIPLDDGKYDLVIKLSPVRDKEGMFYVEAYTDPKAEGLDLSSINEKVLKLDKNNKSKFKEQILKLIEKSGHSVDESEEEAEEESEEDETSIWDEASNNVEEAVDAYNDKPMSADMEGAKIYIHAELTSTGEIESGYVDEESGQCTIILQVIDYEDDEVFDDDAHLKEIELTVVKGDKVDNPENIHARLIREIQAFAKDLELTKIVFSTSVDKKDNIQASFVRGQGTEVSLTAIHASDILSAMDVINAVVEDDEFVNSLPEGQEQSFNIINNEDSFDIEPIDGVDTTGSLEAIRDVQEGFNDVIDKVIDEVELYSLNLSEEEQIKLVPYLKKLKELRNQSMV